MKDGEERGITFVGHPFAPIGRGEDLRCAARAVASVGLPFTIFDLDAPGLYRDQALEKEFNPLLTQELSAAANLFFINGDEVEALFRRLPGLADAPGVQIVIPQWELPRYPDVWVGPLARFDEVWAPSRFVERTLAEAVSVPVEYIPLAVEVVLDSFLPRRAFGLPESSFLFLVSLDFSGYLERKNPAAAFSAFAQVCDQLGPADIRLVVKTSAPWEAASFRRMEQDIRTLAAGSPHQGRIHLIQQTMTDNRVKNLIRCSDCYLSFHRAEGFGRGLAEAMALGKPVIGTGYSGNLDFMNAENSYLVPYQLVTVPPGAYPHAEGQVWAEPDLEEAVAAMIQVCRNQEEGRRLGQAARRTIRTGFSSRAVGLRYRRRLKTLGCL